jgi:hypothetical protein
MGRYGIRIEINGINRIAGFLNVLHEPKDPGLEDFRKTSK